MLTDSEARAWEAAGLVEPFAPPVAPIVEPAETKIVEPTTKEGGWNYRKRPKQPIVPKHVGGGMYEVGSERIKGKVAAQAKADELNK